MTREKQELELVNLRKGPREAHLYCAARGQSKMPPATLQPDGSALQVVRVILGEFEGRFMVEAWAFVQLILLRATELFAYDVFKPYAYRFGVINVPVWLNMDTWV